MCLVVIWGAVLASISDIDGQSLSKKIQYEKMDGKFMISASNYTYIFCFELL